MWVRVNCAYFCACDMHVHTCMYVLECVCACACAYGCCEYIHARMHVCACELVCARVWVVIALEPFCNTLRARATASALQAAAHWHIIQSDESAQSRQSEARRLTA